MIKTNFTSKIKKIASAFFLLLITSCDRGTFVEPGEGFPGKQWQQKTPEEVGLSTHELEANFKEFTGPLVVIRNGYLVYSKGNIAKPVYVYSVGKSITALIFAALLQKGKVNYDDLIPGSGSSGATEVSFRHFMTMTSDYKLKPHQPGKHYAYNNSAVQFYGEYMATTFFEGKSPQKVLQEAIWNHIGRQDKTSFTGHWGGWHGGGFATSTRDLARIGYLVLHEGKWNGTQVLPSSFVKQLYLNQIPTDAVANYSKGPNDIRNQHYITKDLQGNYSFGWWIVNKLYPHTRVRAINAIGHRGKELIVSPEHDLVIVGLPHQENAPNAADYLQAVIDAAIDNSSQLIETSP